MSFIQIFSSPLENRDSTDASWAEKKAEAAKKKKKKMMKPLSSWGVRVSQWPGGWQMINIYVTIHTGIHQSITTALLQRGGAQTMCTGRDSEG